MVLSNYVDIPLLPIFLFFIFLRIPLSGRRGRDFVAGRDYLCVADGGVDGDRTHLHSFSKARSRV